MASAWMDRQPLVDGLCKEGRENTTSCENAGFAVLILTKRCIIIRGICTDISRFCLSLLESVFSVVNQSSANLQKNFKLQQGFSILAFQMETLLR